MGGGVLLPRANHDIEDHPQVTHGVSVQGVAGAARLMRVITYLRAALLAEQGLDRRINVQYPRRVERALHTGHKLWSKPILALRGGHPRQRPAQRTFADDLAHAQNLRTNPVAAQAGNMRVAVVPGENRQKPGAKNVPLVGSDAAAVGQRATVYPRLVQPSGGKKLREKGQLGVALASLSQRIWMRPPGVSTENDSNTEL